MKPSSGSWGFITFLAAISSSPAVAIPMDFDCDVPPNHFSSLQTDLAGPFEISGKITATELRSGKSLPVAGARIFNDRDDTSVGFQLFAPSSRAKQFELLINGTKSGDLKKYAVGRISVDASISFRLILAESGAARLEIGGDSFDIPADPIHSGKAMIFCSTGQFKIAALRFVGGELAAGAAPRDQNSRVKE
ncbi:hypothetical protein MNQ96_07160 [Sphingopyxis granuli]|uniref:hypothetical protein n=1 Tax=Sphingopyxis granuli TaxID=267128 RepID=UPI001F53C049|nr:hypothetical protein [Sphingopyxis granuli]UNK80843.1 hypothetical protein MNQ96_07160 [Sphingopyxis granuli]